MLQKLPPDRVYRMNGRPFEYYRRLWKEEEGYLYYVNSRGYGERILEKHIGSNNFNDALVERLPLVVRNKVTYCPMLSNDKPLKIIIAEYFIEDYLPGDPLKPIDGDFKNCAVTNFRPLEDVTKPKFMAEHKYEPTVLLFKSVNEMASYFKVCGEKIRGHMQGKHYPKLKKWVISRKEKTNEN